MPDYGDGDGDGDALAAALPLALAQGFHPPPSAFVVVPHPGRCPADPAALARAVQDVTGAVTVVMHEPGGGAPDLGLDLTSFPPMFPSPAAVAAADAPGLHAALHGLCAAGDGGARSRPRGGHAPRAADRERAPRPDGTALLVVDAQNYTCRREGALWQGREAAEGAHFFDRLARVVEPAWVSLVAAARAAGVRVVYTVMSAPSSDAALVSADYATSGFRVDRSCWDADVVSTLRPRPADPVLPKGACNVFNATAVDALLRGDGRTHVAVVGVVADQCVAAAVMAACDLGYGVTLVTDGVAAPTPEREAAALAQLTGFCRQRAAAEVVAEWAGAQS